MVQSVTAARRFVGEAVADLPVDAATVDLLTDEVAANAVQHAQGTYEIRILRREDAVRVEVVNDRPEMVAAMREPDAHGGRGLRILDALAHDWGSESGPSEKVVWFEVAYELDAVR